MKTLAASLIALLLLIHVSGQQNLVPNPGFENVNSCPTGRGQLTNATDWLNPNFHSPDLLHRCAPTSGGQGVSVPDNSLGSQEPHTGDGYAAFVAWSNFPLAGSSREYLQVRLTSPLIAGEIYEVSMYLSLADEFKYGANCVDILFSNTEINESHTKLITCCTPQLSMFPSEMVTDTENWVYYSKIYTAVGGEEYLVIGNFKDDASTDTVFVQDAQQPYSHLFIDDVSVKKATACAPITISFNTSHSTACDRLSGGGGSSTASPVGGNAPYTFQWSTGPNDTLPTVLGLATGTYSCTVTDASGCATTEDIEISPLLELETTNIDPSCVGCADGTATVNVSGNGTPPYTYRWNPTDQTTATATGLSEGEYVVTVTDSNGCYDTVSVTIGILGVDDFNNEHSRIYPNPNSGNFVIEIPFSVKATLEFYDPSGRLVKSQAISGKQTVQSGLAKGLYFYKIATSNDIIASGKVYIK